MPLQNQTEKKENLRRDEYKTLRKGIGILRTFIEVKHAEKRGGGGVEKGKGCLQKRSGHVRKKKNNATMRGAKENLESPQKGPGLKLAGSKREEARSWGKKKSPAICEEGTVPWAKKGEPPPREEYVGSIPEKGGTIVIMAK